MQFPGQHLLACSVKMQLKKPGVSVGKGREMRVILIKSTCSFVLQKVPLPLGVLCKASCRGFIYFVLINRITARPGWLRGVTVQPLLEHYPRCTGSAPGELHPETRTGPGFIPVIPTGVRGSLVLTHWCCYVTIITPSSAAYWFISLIFYSSAN